MTMACPVGSSPWMVLWIQNCGWSSGFRPVDGLAGSCAWEGSGGFKPVDGLVGLNPWMVWRAPAYGDVSILMPVILAGLDQGKPPLGITS